jgi:hypothetical protein
MATIGLFVNLTKGGDLKASAAGLIAFSIGIGLLAASLVAIGQLEAGRIMAAGAAITVLIAAVAGFVILTKGGDLNMTALGLVMFAGAMAVLSQVLIHLGSVDTVTIAKGVLGMSIALIALGLTAYVLAPLSPALFSLTAAVVAFGAGCLAIGAGMAAFGLGLALLAKAGPAGAEALRLALKSVIELAGWQSPELT